VWLFWLGLRFVILLAGSRLLLLVGLDDLWLLLLNAAAALLCYKQLLLLLRIQLCQVFRHLSRLDLRDWRHLLCSFIRARWLD